LLESESEYEYTQRKPASWFISGYVTRPKVVKVQILNLTRMVKTNLHLSSAKLLIQYSPSVEFLALLTIKPKISFVRLQYDIMDLMNIPMPKKCDKEYEKEKILTSSS